MIGTKFATRLSKLTGFMGFLLICKIINNGLIEVNTKVSKTVQCLILKPAKIALTI